MSRVKQFWLDMWQEGKIPFHQKTVNTDLLKYWPCLNLSLGAKILLPLCGKSLDMLWLAKEGFHVFGIELSELAVQQFVEDNHLTMTKSTKSGVIYYSTEGIRISVSDIFQLNADLIPKVDAIYDRASLIALPASLRQSYVDICLQGLKSQGKILLKTMRYEDKHIEGPPFSVTSDEVFLLYGSCQTIICIKSEDSQSIDNECLFKQGVHQAKHEVWLIQK
ncbi:thiopurine S-methyltransferase [Legionella jamestowniensis]|uniref:Thiopurine S-methyltransferase n=1 Tax=Legionella jamestowniensis TaxID=455 RepID=A0ABX2XSR4_9GAMM|nr:thiopurine S-methyltransferase [Legionella jamestowniensis]OCH97668.1 thiopurine S-methyltransferase [Legionella jamestowniensis]